MATVNLVRPAAGHAEKLPVQQGDTLAIKFDVKAASQFREGDSLVFAFADGASIALTNFYEVFEPEKPETLPPCSVGDETVPGQEFFADKLEDVQAVAPEMGPDGAGRPDEPAPQDDPDAHAMHVVDGGTDDLIEGLGDEALPGLDHADAAHAAGDSWMNGADMDSYETAVPGAADWGLSEYASMEYGFEPGAGGAPMHGGGGFLAAEPAGIVMGGAGNDLIAFSEHAEGIYGGDGIDVLFGGNGKMLDALESGFLDGEGQSRIEGMEAALLTNASLTSMQEMQEYAGIDIAEDRIVIDGAGGWTEVDNGGGEWQEFTRTTENGDEETLLALRTLVET